MYILKNHAKKLFLLIIIIIFLFFTIGTPMKESYSINKKFTESMTYDKTLGKAKYYSKESGYIFKYSKAYFYNLDCFASVCKEEDSVCYTDNDGNTFTDGMQITLFIWPHSNKYGLDFYQVGDGEEFSEQIYIDRELNILSEGVDKTEVEKVVLKYEDDIIDLLEEADKKWELN